jgi:DNA-binding SARP family transcriptional activator/tetratricopeptide (TPR) repeat protein
MPHSDPAVDQPPVGSVRLPVAVGPGRPIVGLNRQRTLGDGMTGHPIQSSKVQRPQLREQTLARERLLDWLAARIHDRVILILADAGYGKTTLLADYSRRTRIRTLWYRLDEDDRDWIPFLSHIVASGREHDPGFAPKTAALLGDLAMGGPTREAATDVLIRELSGISEHGAVLILDDFHLVDESPDIRYVVREIVARAPERLSIVFASRRTPSIPLAQLRSSGELAELRTDDLRFDAVETERLFNETYGRALEPDVIADVTARTEGWAASLQLVQAALRDRSPAETRRFIRSLSGADQELYDYLAEEVVGDLDEDLQDFLMRTSLLQVVSPELAAVAAGISPDEVARLTTAAERLTLLSRPPRAWRGPQRYHPLVRQFLEARLRATIGNSATAVLHRRVATAAVQLDWRVAAYHYHEAGEYQALSNVIAGAIPEIMGSGQHAAARTEIERVPTTMRPPVMNLVASRIEMQGRDDRAAIDLSEAVLGLVAPGSQESDYALLNLVTICLQTGQSNRCRSYAARLLQTTSNAHLRLIAEGTFLMLDASLTGSLDALARHLADMADAQRGVHDHFFGVSMLNLSIASIARDDLGAARDAADAAIEALEGTSSQIELSAALMARAYVYALIGRENEAIDTIDKAREIDELEVVLERTALSDSYLDPDAAESMLASLSANNSSHARMQIGLQGAWYLTRRGRFDEAGAILARYHDDDVGLVAQATARMVTMAYIAVASGSENGLSLSMAAQSAAAKQGATRWRRVAELIGACCESDGHLSHALRTIGEASPWNVTFVADLVSRRLDSLDVDALKIVESVSTLHPGRWRFVLRREVDAAGPKDGLAAAKILELVGTREDVRRLRTFGRQRKALAGASGLGRQLARRLAPKVLIHDQGRVAIRVGGRHILGSTVRRKVLSLLCFLITRPDMSSTRDQVLDALWPDLQPVDALNSLNQTVYFLRRVLEEDYVEDLSPGYVHHNSDLIWLDTELVSSRSNKCRDVINALPSEPTPDQVAKLVDEYGGRFALDFEYEEWAGPYRDWLHASYLEIVERAVASDMESGHFERGIKLARRALDIDPTADNIEVSLLRLYRASGAHAAAAEQYSHYASSIRDQLGIEPQALESL